MTGLADLKMDTQKGRFEKAVDESQNRMYIVRK